MPHCSAFVSSLVSSEFLFSVPITGVGVAQTVGRGIALLFHYRALGGVSVQQHVPAVLYPRERPGTHCTGGWLSPRAGLDGRKISPHREVSS
jgi:hypothetical protein